MSESLSFGVWWNEHTYHQAVVQHPGLAQAKLANLISQHNTSDHSCSRGSESTTKGYWVDNVNFSLNRKSALPVTSQDIERGSRDEVAVGTQWHLISTLTFISNDTVERSF